MWNLIYKIKKIILNIPMVELFNLYFTKKVIKQYKDKNLTSKVNVLVCYKIDLVVEWRKGDGEVMSSNSSHWQKLIN